MGILDDLKKWAHPYEDEDEEYEDDFPDLRDRGDTGAFADRRSAESAPLTSAATRRRIAATRS